MAIYDVAQSGGKTPNGARVGDYVKTAGGTFQILNPSNYKGMDNAQLANLGVGYNPASGHYSRRVNDAEIQAIEGGVNLMTTSKLDQWLGNANQSALAKIGENYNTNVANVNTDYNKSKADYVKQQGDVVNKHIHNLNQLYEDTYYANKVTQQQAANAGMTSAAQGAAMTGSGLVSAALKAADLNNDKDTSINDLNNQLLRLAEDRNIKLTELEKNKMLEELQAMNSNQLSYLEQSMKLEGANNDAINNYASEKRKMDWQSAEAEKDRQHQLAMMNAKGSGGSGGGHGYFRGGRYYGGGYRHGYNKSSGAGGGSSSMSAKRVIGIIDNALNQIDRLQKNGKKFPNNLIHNLQGIQQGIQYGTYTPEQGEAQFLHLIEKSGYDRNFNAISKSNKSNNLKSKGNKKSPYFSPLQPLYDNFIALSNNAKKNSGNGGGYGGGGGGSYGKKKKSKGKK